MKRQVKEAVKYPLERTMRTLETRLVARAKPLQFSPIFIIAPARSGSTLLYQAMTRYFKLCYFSNSMTRFPDSPVCMAYLLAPFGGCDPPENFRSQRGYVDGGRAPTDASKVWDRWFRSEPQYTPNGVLTQSQQCEVRTTISRFQDAFDAPFISKTQRHCGRILALAEIFPEGVFVRLHRNPFDMARSRWQIYKTDGGANMLWQSYRPSNSADIRTEDPIEHICHQVAFTEADIDHDRQALGSRGFFDVDYEAFCRQPIETLERFARFYSDCGTGPTLSKRHDIPGSFSSAGSRDIAPEEAAKIRRHLKSLMGTTTAGEATS